jgi:hypothetical protein
MRLVVSLGYGKATNIIKKECGEPVIIWYT